MISKYKEQRRAHTVFYVQVANLKTRKIPWMKIQKEKEDERAPKERGPKAKLETTGTHEEECRNMSKAG